MNFEFTEEQLAVQEVARTFAEKRLKPRAEEFDAEAKMDRALLKELGDLGLMGVTSAGEEHGRDASQLLTTGKAPSDWNDVAFLRSTGEERGWLAAVTDRYKIIYSTADVPWLFDLEKDPDELVNVFNDPAYRETVRGLSQKLADYGKKYNDPRAANADIQSDLEWAIKGTGPYVSKRPERPPAPAKAKGAKEKRRKKSRGGEQ